MEYLKFQKTVAFVFLSGLFANHLGGVQKDELPKVFSRDACELDDAQREEALQKVKALRQKVMIDSQYDFLKRTIYLLREVAQEHKQGAFDSEDTLFNTGSIEDVKKHTSFVELSAHGVLLDAWNTGLGLTVDLICPWGTMQVLRKGYLEYESCSKEHIAQWYALLSTFMQKTGKDQVCAERNGRRHVECWIMDDGKRPFKREFSEAPPKREWQKGFSALCKCIKSEENSERTSEQ